MAGSSVRNGQLKVFFLDPATGDTTDSPVLQTDTSAEEAHPHSGTFIFDSKTFSYMYWMPLDGRVPLGVVFLVHSYGQHLGSALYAELIQELVKNSYAVVGHDHFGHGQSGGESLKFGSIQEVVDPVVAHIEALKAWDSEISSLPFIICGDSYGALIALKALLKRRDYFKGCVCISPYLPKESVSWVGLILSRIFSWITPNWVAPRSNANDASQIKENDVLEALARDVKTWKKGILIKHHAMIHYACAEVRRDVKEINVPFLTLHGEDNRFVTLPEVKSFMDCVTAKDKELVVIPNASNNLLAGSKETRTQVLCSVKKFMDMITKKHKFASMVKVFQGQ